VDYEGLRAHRRLVEHSRYPADRVSHRRFLQLQANHLRSAVTRIGPNGSVIGTPSQYHPAEHANPGAVVHWHYCRLELGAAGRSRAIICASPASYTNDQFDTKIDHRLSNSDSLFGRSIERHHSRSGAFDGFISAGGTPSQHPQRGTE
jgi:hypothetical protein